MSPTRTYDLHAHCLVPSVQALVAEQDGFRAEQALQARQMGAASMEHTQGLFPTWMQRLTDLETRLALMDEMGIDVQVVSVSPTQYHYWAEPDLAEEIVRLANDGVAELVAHEPQRLQGLGTVALQHPQLAARQLEAAIAEQGLRGAVISSAIHGVDLSDPGFDPFWKTAERLGGVVFIHPFGCSLNDRIDRWYLANIVGQPAETTVALSHLIFGGVLDRFPSLKVLAAHGGGYLPLYAGRSDHGYAVRPESRTSARPPSEYLGRMWFDTVVHSPDVLRRLIDAVGASQVVLGTDYPFDMGVDDPLALLDVVPALTSDERDAIAGTNAAHLLGIDDAVGSAGA
jgi:aminocarboxymuconate-semialdehyde decarboxylase